MKFLFVSNFISDENSGAASHILFLGRALSDKGHAVDIIFRNSILPSVKKNLLIHLGVFFLFPVIVVPLIFLKTFRKRYDFIVFSSGDGFFYAFLAKMVLHLKSPFIIMRSHGYEPLYLKEFETEKAFHPHKRFSFRERLFISKVRVFQAHCLAYLCDAILPLNLKEEAYLKAKYADKPICAVPAGLGEIFFSKNEVPARERDILYVGGWCRMKGRDYLVEVIRTLVKERADLTVSLLGVGVNEEDVIAAFPREIQSRINVRRHLARVELKKEYLSHKIFLFPSLFEGYGRVVVEAMASGMAVVISKDLGVSELIVDGHNGFSVEKRDVEGFVRSIGRLLSDDALKERISRNARETVKDMGWDSISDIFLHACREVIDGKNLRKD